MTTSASFSGRKGGIDTRPAEVSTCVGSYVGEHEMHYTYMLRAINPIDERVEYIGVRSCEGHFEDDANYMSSSDAVRSAMDAGIRFEKIFLADWPTREDAVSHEVMLHEWFDVARRPEFFNKARQTSVGFDTGGTRITDEHKKKISEGSIRAQKNPEVKAKHSAALRRYHSSPEGKKKSVEVASKIWSHPEFREKHAKAIRAAFDRPGHKERMGAILREVNSRPGAKEKISAGVKRALNSPEGKAKNSAAKKKMWANEEFYQRRVEGLRASNSRLDVRAKISAKRKAAWADPEYRARMSAAIRAVQQKDTVRAMKSAKAKETNSRPEVKAKISAANKLKWTEPEFRAARSAQAKETNNRPEVLAKMSASLKAHTDARSRFIEETGYVGDKRRVKKAMIDAYFNGGG